MTMQFPIDDEQPGDGPIDPLRSAYQAVSAATDALGKLQALKAAASELAIGIRHGRYDYYEIEKGLLDLAHSHGLVEELTLEAVELVITTALKTPALIEESTTSEEPPPARLIQSSKEFIAGFIPPDYLIDGILQKRFIYSMTGKTGAGKTAILLLIAGSVWLARPIGSYGVERGRVLYLAGENPDDIRMRWIATAQHMDFDPDEAEVYFIPGTFKISEMLERIEAEARERGPFDLVTVDTSAAYFEGDQENDNVQQGIHARRLRELVRLHGGPCVIVAAHPPKNAPDDNLQPRGGGSFIAEVDGNLTARKRDGLVELHWQGKFRGPDFAPVTFQLRGVTHEQLKDSKGRTIPTVIADYISETAQDNMATAARDRENQVLAAYADKPNASMIEIARALGWIFKNGEPDKTKVHRAANKLKDARLLIDERGKPTNTDKGRRLLDDLKIGRFTRETPTSENAS
jgi:hypothetical protein